VVAPKRLELLHELVPTPTVMALLVNPANPITKASSSEMASAAHSLGVELHILHASSEREFDAVFTNLIQLRAGDLVINADTFLDGRSGQLAMLTLRHALPAIGGYHEFAAAGGLASYGGGLLDAYRLAGVSTGRIQGRKARRPACAAGDKDRAGHQPQDCEGAWSYSSTFVDWSRRRGGGFRSGLAAKTETKSIPVLFIAGEDPVKLGLVSSLAKAGRQPDRDQYPGGRGRDKATGTPAWSFAESCSY